jgi:dimeric dUTPase (all-alpha-NTP-PPase superfamily)
MMDTKILLMLQLQNQLNDATNGEKWKEGITKNGKIINWKRCIYMECAEMIDSFSWKHWKNIEQAPDWDNMQIEVVDVWHFVMSLALEEYAKNFQGGVEEIAMAISEMESFTSIQTQESDFSSSDEVIAKVEDIMRLALAQEGVAIEKLFEEFFALVKMSGLNLETLYRLYVGKNILNQFRQDHGYKDGSYIKVWAGQEDCLGILEGIYEGNSRV